MLIFTFMALLIRVAEVTAQSDLCFLAPYVSSIHVGEINQTTSDGGQKMFIEWTLDYKRRFLVTDIVFYKNFDASLINNFNTSRARTVMSENQPTEIIYRDGYKLTSTNTLSLRHTKRDYLEIVDRQLSAKPVGGPASVEAAACSSFYIFDAHFVRRLNSTHHLEVIYHRSRRCFAVRDDTEAKVFSPVPMPPGSPALYIINSSYRRITAAAFMEPFLFEVNPDGAMMVRRYKSPQDYPNELNPLGKMSLEVPQVYNFYPSRFSAPIFIGERGCLDQYDELERFVLSPGIKDELKSGKPFRAMFNFKNYFHGYRHDSLHAERYDQDPAVNLNVPNAIFFQNVLPFMVLQDLQFSVETISVVSGINFEPSMQAVVRHRKSGNLFYAFNNNAPKPIQVQPDAIVHWTTCRKVVTFYGFVYTMHEFLDDIISKPSTWQRLDESLFDHPIETAYAEGDRFWFVTKASTTRILFANSNNCSRLSFIPQSLNETHFLQLFRPLETQVLYEGRYFDGSKWIPSWNPESTTIIWPYIVVLALLTAFFLIILVIYVLRRTEQAQGDTIYSVNRASSVATVSALGNRQQPSKMPLFSHHNSLKSLQKSTVRSHSLPGVRSPKKKRSPKKSSPKKSVSKKSLSPKTPPKSRFK